MSIATDTHATKNEAWSLSKVEAQAAQMFRSKAKRQEWIHLSVKLNAAKAWCAEAEQELVKAQRMKIAARENIDDIMERRNALLGLTAGGEAPQ